MGKKGNERGSAPLMAKLTEAEEEYKRVMLELKNKLNENQQRWDNQRLVLGKTLKYFQDTEKLALKAAEKNRRSKEWANYFNCDNFPYNSTVSEIKEYYERWSFRMISDLNSKIDWHYGVDDRLMLTQDRSIASLSYKNLETQPKDFGKRFLKDVINAAVIVNNIDEVLNSTPPIFPSYEKTYFLELKRNIQEKLKEYFAVYIFKVLRSTNESVKMLPTFCTKLYSFVCDEFILDLSIIGHVRNAEDNKYQVPIDVAKAKLSFFCPKDIEELVVCFLWTYYDHYSAYTESNDLKIYFGESKDIITSLKEQQSIWLELQKNCLKYFAEEMVVVRETLQKQIDDALEAEKNKDDQKLKKLKGLDKPISFMNPKNYNNDVKAGTILNEIYTNTIQTLKYNLKKDEVNLRSHRIINGVFQINISRWPVKNVDLSNRQVLLLEEFDPFHLKTVPTKCEKIEDNLLSSAFEIEITLSKNIMWLGEPIVCRWEPWTESHEFAELDQEDQYIYLNFEEYMAELRKSLTKHSQTISNSEIVIKDFNVNSNPKDVDIYLLLKDVVTPIIPFYQPVQMVQDDANQETKETGKFKKIKKKAKESHNKADSLKSENTFRPVFLNKSARPDITIISSLSEGQSRSAIGRSNLRLREQARLANMQKFSYYYRAIQDNFEAETKPIYNITDKKSNNAPSSEGGQENSMIEKENKLKKEKKVVAKSDRAQSLNENRLKGRWCTHEIIQQKFNEKNNTVKFYSRNLGTFGLANYNYYLFPFKSWEMKPDPKRENEVQINVKTQFMDFFFTITKNGYFLRFPPGKGYFIKDLKQPTTLHTLRTKLESVGLNIFPARDIACFVYEVNEKDFFMEKHCYYSMACFCEDFEFKDCFWNKYCGLQRILLKAKYLRIDLAEVAELLITPTECHKVVVFEECSEDLNHISLRFEIDSAVQFELDLFNMLGSLSRMMSYKPAQNYDLKWNVTQFLMSLRPFSFC